MSKRLDSFFAKHTELWPLLYGLHRKIEETILKDMGVGVKVLVYRRGDYKLLCSCTVRIENLNNLFPWMVQLRNFVEEMEFELQVAAMHYKLDKEE